MNLDFQHVTVLNREAERGPDRSMKEVKSHSRLGCTWALQGRSYAEWGFIEDDGRSTSYSIVQMN